jgi:hypothetical protein
VADGEVRHFVVVLLYMDCADPSADFTDYFKFIRVYRAIRDSAKCHFLA